MHGIALPARPLWRLGRATVVEVMTAGAAESGGDIFAPDGRGAWGWLTSKRAAETAVCLVGTRVAEGVRSVLALEGWAMVQQK